jgi:hypothetical protein
MDDSGFLWSFPCYVIVSQYTMNSRTGRAILDDNLTFVVGEITPGGEQSVLIFTDSDLAHRHRVGCPQASSLGLLEIDSAMYLKAFLQKALQKYRYVGIDVNQETGRVQGFSIKDVIAALDRPSPSPDPNDRL